MKRQALFTVLLPLLVLAACTPKPKNLVHSGMTTSRLVELYGNPVRKETADNGSETWFYKAQKFVDSTSQEEWNTDTASPDFSTHSDPGSPSSGSSVSVSRTATTETIGIQVREGKVTQAAPDNVKIISGG